MIEKRFRKMLALNRGASILERGIVGKIRESTPAEIEHYCLDLITDRLAPVCVVCFQLSKSDKATNRSIIENDFFVVALLCAVGLQQHLKQSHQPPEDRVAGVDTVVELLLSVGDAKNDLRNRVRPKLIAAFWLGMALRNIPPASEMGQGMQGTVLVEDESYLAFSRGATLGELVRETRRRFALSAPEV
jgi:hypothetical protein